ncbi:MAG: hypothetical protein JJ969_16315 [Rhizobiaceae bacterium]|nr:hypothetical protein [Rhizobiaceae bacterium]
MANNSQGVDFEKMEAEMLPLRDFIDFVNAQVGVYMDSLSGFDGNRVRVERQVARVIRPRPGLKEGKVVMMMESFEDPRSPEAIHHRIVAADEFIAANSERGFNHRQLCWSVIVFIFAFWDEEIRPQIARVRGVEPNDIKVDALGDLRLLRKSIIHAKGVLSASDHAKLKKMADLVRPGERIALSHDEMQRLFAQTKQAIAELLLAYTDHLPGAPDASSITGVAIQTTKGRRWDPD